MRTALDRMVRILIHPRDEWQQVRKEPATYGTLLVGYVAHLAILPPLAVIARGLVLDRGLPAFSFSHLLITNLLWYCMYIVNVAVAGAIITFIVTAPDARWSGVDGFKVASYSFTPLFVTGALAVIPKMGWTIYAGILYGIYLLFLGIAVLAGTSKNRSAGYAFASFVGAAVLVGSMNLVEYFVESFVVNTFGL